MNTFQMGDTAWSAGYAGERQVQIPCPVCYGKCKIDVILGNGDRVTVDCDYCGKGYEGARGYVIDWEFKATARRVTITGMEIDQHRTRYKSDCTIYDELFSTREEALAKSQSLIDKRIEDDMTRAECLKANHNKSYSWNAGYHLRQAKDCERRAEYHRRKAVICKDRARAKKSTVDHS